LHDSIRNQPLPRNREARKPRRPRRTGQSPITIKVQSSARFAIVPQDDLAARFAGQKGGAAGRFLFLDVEQADGGGYALVLRGRDKTLADHAPSAAQDGEDRKSHRPNFLWSDERGESIPFALATGDRDTLERVCNELLAFYANSGQRSYSDRLAGLSAEGRTVLLHHLLHFFRGALTPTQQAMRFADYSSRTSRTARLAA